MEGGYFSGKIVFNKLIDDKKRRGYFCCFDWWSDVLLLHCCCSASGCKKSKMAAAVFMIFSLHFCIVEGSCEVSSVLYTVSGHDPIIDDSCK